MGHEPWGVGRLDYAACRYGTSKLVFRGPARRLDLPHLAALGGTDTFGRFLRRPWPALTEAVSGLRIVNFGAAHAGIEAMTDPSMTALLQAARGVIVQLPGAQTQSNRYFTVHPRRNDRFITARSDLRRLFPEVDFTEFHFTRHLLRALARRDPGGDRMALVVADLQAGWLHRMERLVSAAPGPRILLWLGEGAGQAEAPWEDPLFVTRPMVSALAEQADGLVAILPDHGPGSRGLIHDDAEAEAAAASPGAATHEAIARSLAPLLDAGLAGSGQRQVDPDQTVARRPRRDVA